MKLFWHFQNIAEHEREISLFFKL